GETSKLTATGTYANGTTADVSASIRWSSALISVVTVSTSGLVTATGLGTTYVFAQYAANPSLSKSLRTTVTPTGTFAVSGWTREPGNGGLGGVRVLNTASGQSTLSEASGDSQGLFTLGGLTTRHFTFTKAGYEDAELDLAPGIEGDIPLQPVV